MISLCIKINSFYLTFVSCLQNGNKHICLPYANAKRIILVNKLYLCFCGVETGFFKCEVSIDKKIFAVKQKIPIMSLFQLQHVLSSSCHGSSACAL